MTYYKGIIYFRNGTTQETGATNNRMQAEEAARRTFEQMDRCACGDAFRPTRYEVVVAYEAN